jgi:hypothetical protein
MADKLDIESSLSRLSPDARARVEKVLQESLAKEAATERRPHFDRSYDRSSQRLADVPLDSSKE